MKNVKNRTRNATLALLLAAAISPQPLMAQQVAGQSPCQVAQQESLPDTIARVELGVVVVWTLDEEGNRTGHGSGFFIDATRVVTNYHVVERAAGARVVLANGKSYPVKTVNATDMHNDLVVIEVDIPKDAGHHPLSLHTAQPRKGQEVWVLGAPHGLDFSLSSGIVSAVRSMPDMTTSKIIQIDAPSSPGSSGGPVINRCGEVIGVSSFGLSEGQNLNFAQGAWNIEAIAQHQPRTLQSWAVEQARASTSRRSPISSRATTAGHWTNSSACCETTPTTRGHGSCSETSWSNARIIPTPSRRTANTSRPASVRSIESIRPYVSARLV